MFYSVFAVHGGEKRGERHKCLVGLRFWTRCSAFHAFHTVGVWAVSICRFRREGAEVAHHAFRAFWLAGGASVTAMEDQPVVGVLLEPCGDCLFQIVFDGAGGFAF